VEVDTFVSQAPIVIVDIAEGGPFDYWLVVRQGVQPIISVPLDSEMVPRLHPAEHAFMFSFKPEEGEGTTWCVKFAEEETFVKWKDAFTQYMWQGRNKILWAKAKADEQKYIESAYDDVEMDDVEGYDAEEEEEDDEEEAERTLTEEGTSEDEDSESDNERFSKVGRGKNEKLTVGYKNDRSFVVRGDMIGVFKHTDDNKLKFATSINKISDLKGKSFTPKKVSGVCA
jgi:hypothetical protein